MFGERGELIIKTGDVGYVVEDDASSVTSYNSDYSLPDELFASEGIVSEEEEYEEMEYEEIELDEETKAMMKS